MSTLEDERTVSDEQLDDLERSFGAPDATESGSQKLAEKEDAAADDTLNNGYTGAGKNIDNSSKPKQNKQEALLSKLNGSDSKFKKKIALAGAAAGGSVVVAVIMFIALLPLKINAIVTNLETKFAATSESALGTETDNLFNGYVQKAIIPSLASGKCHTTVDPSCKVIAAGTGPIGQLYASWSKGRLENKLATKFGLVFAKNADGRFVMNLNGRDIDLNSVRSGETSIFDLPGSREVSRSEIRTELKSALRNGTLWDKTYGRFKYGKFLEKQFGIKRCVIACDTKDKFSDSVIDKKLAAKAFLVQRLVPAKYSVVMGCLLQPSLCESTLGNAAPGDTTRLTPAQRQVQQILADANSHFSDEKLAKLVSTSNDVAKDGFGKVMAREATKKLVGTVSTEAAAEAAGSAAEKAVPVVGWALLAVQLVALGDTIGPIVQHIGYATNTASAVETYSTYKTVAAEARSGHMDSTELGSFTDALSKNLSGSKNDQVDATSTPLYNSLVGSADTNAASMFSGIFGTASADSTSGSKYKCDDGSSVPAGKLVCPEEVFDNGNDVANNVSSFINSIPVLPTVANWINDIAGGIVSVVFSTLNEGCTNSLSPLKYLGCPQMENAVSHYTGNIFNWVGQKLIVTPFSNNMSGGRTGDMIAAGADVAQNKSCQIDLGCGKVSDAAAAEIQGQQIAEARQEFDSKPMFARMFDTSSSYSLVSHLAAAMPGNLAGASGSLSSTILTNPLHGLGSAFSSIFSSSHAFAGPTASADAFGVNQYAYLVSEIPKDPQTFWDNNCVTGPLATYNEASNTLDVSAWLNANQTLDDKTGEATNTATNACLLIQTTVQSAGAIFDPSLLPTDSANSATISPTDPSTTPLTTNLPLSYPTPDATQAITVVADSVTSTKATLQAWERTDAKGTWTKHGDAIDAYVGSEGLTGSPKEGKNATPIGSFTLTQAFGAKTNPGTTLRYFKTGPNDWWDENPQDPTYNQRVVLTGSPGGASEHLASIVPAYNYAVVIDANMNPIVAGDGSGFFLHVSEGKPTAGCVAIPQDDLVAILKWLKPGDKPRIVIGTQAQ